MERKITLSKNTSIIGVLYDDQNQPIERGEFEIIADRDASLKLKHKSSGLYHKCKKENFDAGERIPRRIPKNEQTEEKEYEEKLKNSGKSKNPEDSKESEGNKENNQSSKGDKVNFIKLSDSKEIMLVTGETEIVNLINAGIKNIWMVGPAGCGKTTMAKQVARSLGKPFLSISCSIGTSAAEFQGYKYPTPRPTSFGEYYRKPAIILLDEFTALDPAVAQVVNAALANGFINITSSKIPVHRHNDCIIIATSNTFGTGSDLQYVANQQLDASTIDRFVGGVIKIDYNSTYEKQYDKEVLTHITRLRRCISEEFLRRIASTRMLIEGEKLKKAGFSDWKDRLVSNWTPEEKEILQAKLTDYAKEEKANKVAAVKNSLDKNPVAELLEEEYKRRSRKTG